MDRGAWWAAVHGVAKSRTWLSDFTFTFHFPSLEKEMATHSSVLAWRILGTGEPGGLPSMGLHRVRHNWSDLALSSSIGLEEEMPTWVLQYSCLENPMYRGAWQALVHWVAKSWTWLRTHAYKGRMGAKDSDNVYRLHFLFLFVLQNWKKALSLKANNSPEILWTVIKCGIFEYFLNVENKGCSIKIAKKKYRLHFQVFFFNFLERGADIFGS